MALAQLRAVTRTRENHPTRCWPERWDRGAALGDCDRGEHRGDTHLAPGRAQHVDNPVDGHDVPVPHFGLILTIPRFHDLAERLRTAGTPFVIEPHVRFAGQTGEQWTMFLLDPAGNALEFKAFADDSQVFATNE